MQKVDILSGAITSIFFVYTVFCKKEFSYKDVIGCFGSGKKIYNVVDYL